MKGISLLVHKAASDENWKVHLTLSKRLVNMTQGIIGADYLLFLFQIFILVNSPCGFRTLVLWKQEFINR